MVRKKKQKYTLCYYPGLMAASGFKRAMVLSPFTSVISLFPALDSLGQKLPEFIGWEAEVQRLK